MAFVDGFVGDFGNRKCEMKFGKVFANFGEVFEGLDFAEDDVAWPEVERGFDEVEGFEVAGGAREHFVCAFGDDADFAEFVAVEKDEFVVVA